MLYYRAGGSVRDMLIGHIPKDYDIVFGASPSSFIKANPEARKLGNGPAYGLFGLEYTPLNPHGEKYDVMQRDFTINAILLASDGRLIMHPHTVQDLQAGQLRLCTPDSLQADPCRVLRAARLCAEIPELHPDLDCLIAMCKTAETSEYAALPAERTGREVMKACCGKQPGNFLRILHAGHAMTPWIAEFQQAATIPAGPAIHHTHSVLEHTACVMDAVAQLCDGKNAYRNEHHAQTMETSSLRMEAVWMAFCHDIGKITTPHWMWPHHYGHEQRGACMAQVLGQRLHLPARLITCGVLAARFHMALGQYERLRPGTRVDMLVEIGSKKMLEALCLCAMADSEDDTIAARVRHDWEIIRHIQLPPIWRDKGPLSGVHLRELRCQALTMQRQAYRSPAP